MKTRKMTKEEIIRMCVDWMTGADDELKMSDWLCACFEAGIDEDEIQEEAEKRIKEKIF